MILMMKDGRFILQNLCQRLQIASRGKVWELFADERTAGGIQPTIFGC